MWMDYPGGKWRKNMEKEEKRFGCDECGHIFVMECDEDMIPRFCPFCSAPVYDRDEEEESEYDDDNYPFGD